MKKDNYESRKKLMAFIHRIEREFPVDKWEVNGHKIWPLLRIELAFNSIKIQRDLPNQIDKKKNISEKVSVFQSITLKVYRSYKTILNLLSLFRRRNKYEYIFSGTYLHRQLINSIYVNKLFDVIISDLKTNRNESLIIENTSKKFYNQGKLTNSKNTLFLENYLAFFIYAYRFCNKYFYKDEVVLIKYDCFIDQISNSSLFSQTFKTDLSKGEKYIKNKSYFAEYLFFKFILSIIKPKAVFGLCFYHGSIMALFAASKELNIPTIEIQHGPVSSLHPAYSKWSNVPKTGYDMLPEIFWAWDEESKKDILSGLGSNKMTQVENYGNPWHQYWFRNNLKGESALKGKNVILYTMQPLENYLDDFVIDAIKKTCRNYDWWIRIHPQQLLLKEEIIDFFIQKEIIDLINFDDATNIPLPIILKHIKIHITKTSGTTLEAIQFGIKTILIHELGKEYYLDLLNQGKVFYLLKKQSNDLINLLNELMEIKKVKYREKKINYCNILDKLFYSTRLE